MKPRGSSQSKANKGGGGYSKGQLAVNPHSPPASTDSAFEYPAMLVGSGDENT